MRPRNYQPNMGWKRKVPLAALLCLSTLVYWGCHGPGTNPTAPPVVPLRGFNLNFTVPLSNEVKASLLNVSSNEVLYNISGPGMTPVTGVAGPYSTNASVGAGELDFPIPVPQGSSRLIAFQLNNAANHQPLALGAVLSDINAGGVSDIWVTMGSVVRNCYTVDTSPYSGDVYFNILSDSLTATGPATLSADLAVTSIAGAYYLVAQSPDQIAYMGNGPLVNFASVPATFTNTSSSLAKQAAGAFPSYLQAGDVYCVSLGAGGVGGHAWIQIINPNQPFGLYPPGPQGPKFFFRVNRSLPYFAYDETTADANGTCSTPVPTPTNVPTNTSTPTNSPTSTYSPTITDTPTSTSTPTITPTPSSPTPTFTNTNSNTPTNSPTFSSPTPSFTPTSTATITPTAASVPYIASSTVSCLDTDNITAACQSFLLTINANNPMPVTAVSYAAVSNATNGDYVWVGPWSYSGNGTSFSVTLSGYDMGVSTAAPASINVFLYNADKNQLLSNIIPAGAPLTLEAPPGYLYPGYSYLSCNTYAEDGNCQTFYLNVDAYQPVCSEVSQTSMVELLDKTSGVSLFFGPITYTCDSFDFPLTPKELELAPGQQAVSHVFQTLLYDSSGVTVWDYQPAGTFSFEYPAAYLSSSTVSALTTDPANGGACQSFVLTLNADSPAGVTQTSYAYVTDLANSNALWIGPWTYVGTGTSFSVTLTGYEFGMATTQAPLPTNFQIQLYDESRSAAILDSGQPGGEPLTLEAPPAYIDNGYADFSCLTTAEDGFCQAFQFNISLTTPNSASTETSLIELLDESNGVSQFLGPVTYTSVGYNFALSPEQFGVTVQGQQAVSQQFEAFLFNSDATTLLDEQSVTPLLNMEFPSDRLSSSSISCLTTDTVTGACRSFVFTVDAASPAGVTATSYARLGAKANGSTVDVGPFTYSGSGPSFSTTLTGYEFGLTNTQAITTSFGVTLLDATKSTILDTGLPAGGALTLEAPAAYIYSTGLGCQTAAEDGFCQAFDLNVNAQAPNCSSPVTCLASFLDTTNGVSITLGPVTACGARSFYLTPAQLNLLPGQQAASQVIQTRLYDSSGVTLLDAQPAGILNVEYPGAYLASTSVACVAGDVNGCRNFQLTINANAPAGVTATSYAYVTDLANNNSIWVGPWSYAGTGQSFSVTLSGAEFLLPETQAPTLTNFQVTLWDGTRSVTLDSDQPTGEPITLEPSPAYIYNTGLNCQTTAEDGNCQAFSMYVEPYASNCPTTQVGLVELLDTSSGTSVMLGPVTSCNSYTFFLTPELMGLTAPGQEAASQVFQTILLDASGVTIWDSQPTGTLSLEHPQQYLASSNVSCLTTDIGNGACQSFVLTINALAPAGVTETSYARVVDFNLPGSATLVGPFSYTSTGPAFSVTMNGYDFSMPVTSGPQAASFGITLLAADQSTQLDRGQTVGGGPLNLEAPPAFFDAGYTALSCAATAQDGFCQSLRLNFYPYTGSSATTQIGQVVLIDTSNGTSAVAGPVTATNNAPNFATTFTAAQFNVPAGSSLANQQFEALLTDATGVTVWDATRPSGSPANIENGGATIALAGVTLSAGVTAADGAWQSFVLDIASTNIGNAAVSNYAYVTDTTNNTHVWTGPINYSGTNNSYSVTLYADDFAVTAVGTPVAAAFSVSIYSEANNNILLVSTVPVGSPATLEGRTGYLDYSSTSCLTGAEDGSCVNFTLTTYPYTPNTATPTTQTGLIEVEDLTTGVSQFLGPVTYTYGSSFGWNLSSEQFGVTPSAAASQAFQINLMDSTGTTILDSQSLGTLDLEYPMPHLASSTVSCLLTDGGNGNCQSLLFTINPVGPSGVPSTSYAEITALANGRYTRVGPFNYTGAGSYSVTLTGADFGLTNPTTVIPGQFAVTLMNQAGSRDLDFIPVSVPGGPLTLESPLVYLYSASVACQTTAEDGHCSYLQFYTGASAPNATVTQMMKIADLTQGVTVPAGMVTFSSNAGYYWYMPPSAFGLAPGQQAVSHLFEAYLYDPTGTNMVSTYPLGAASYEYPMPYLASSSITTLLADTSGGANNGDTQAFVLTLHPSGPSTNNSTSHAVVADLTNGYTTTVGPFNYTGDGSYSVTLTGSAFNVYTAGATQVAQFAVTLYNQKNQILDSTVVPGGPLTLESPLAYLYGGNVSCYTTQEDGNCGYLQFYTSVYAPSGTVTQTVMIADLSQGTTALAGAVTYTSSTGYYWYLSPSSFQYLPGQLAVSQAFQALLYDSSGTTLLSNYPLGTANVEYPSPYIASCSVSSLLNDPSGANAGDSQAFLLTLNPTGPAGVPKTSHAIIVDLASGATTTTGPFNYTGAGTYSVTLTGADFNIYAAGATQVAQFAVTLMSQQNQLQDSANVTGGPLTMEAAPYITGASLYCQTTAEDGNCLYPYIYTYISVPSGSVTGQWVLIDLTRGTTVLTQPTTTATNSNYMYFTPEQAGLTPGQQALHQQYLVEFTNPAGTTVLSSVTTSQTDNLEYAMPYIAPSSVTMTCMTTGGTGNCEAFQMSASLVGPAGVHSSSYLEVDDLASGYSRQLGPFLYTGSANVAVTFSSVDFGLSTLGVTQVAPFAVTLINNLNEEKILDVAQSANAPLTLEPPTAYIGSSGFSCGAPAEDGYCTAVTFLTYLYSPGCSSQSGVMKLVNLSNSTAVTLSPAPTGFTCGSGYSWALTAGQLGISTAQSAPNQVLQAYLYDSTGTLLLSESAPATMNLESP